MYPESEEAAGNLVQSLRSEIILLNSRVRLRDKIIREQSEVLGLLKERLRMTHGTRGRSDHVGAVTEEPCGCLS